MRAGRRSILLCREFLKERQSFILETTLAGNGSLAVMRRAKDAGYRVQLVYLALASAELHTERVRLRVSLGGHDVADSDIRRRFSRSLSRPPEAIRIADEAVLFDNSGTRPQRVLVLQENVVIWRVSHLPTWVERLVSDMQ